MLNVTRNQKCFELFFHMHTNNQTNNRRQIKMKMRIKMTIEKKKKKESERQKGKRIIVLCTRASFFNNSFVSFYFRARFIFSCSLLLRTLEFMMAIACVGVCVSVGFVENMTSLLRVPMVVGKTDIVAVGVWLILTNGRSNETRNEIEWKNVLFFFERKIRSRRKNG